LRAEHGERSRLEAAKQALAEKTMKKRSEKASLSRLLQTLKPHNRGKFVLEKKQKRD
jgi:hypothetical protein